MKQQNEFLKEHDQKHNLHSTIWISYVKFDRLNVQNFLKMYN